MHSERKITIFVKSKNTTHVRSHEKYIYFRRSSHHYRRDCTIAGKHNQQYQITTGHHYSELYNYLNDHTPDLLIIDYEIQDKTALDVITYLQKKGVNIPQLIYTMHTEFWIIKLLIKAEVAGIVTKNDKIEEIEKAIHNILHEGNKYYSPTALNVVLSIMGDHSTEKSITYTPSPRENEIIQMLSCGLTSDEIAHKLNLSKNTIDTMRKNILLKSGATNVSHLMRIAFLKGWITE